MMARLAYFWACCHARLIWIRDVHGETIPLIPNDAQAMLQARMMEMAAAGRPVRVVILKGRKRGISTYVQALGVFLVAMYANQQCKTLAHTGEATDEIFGIARNIATELKAAIPIDPKSRSIDCTDLKSWYHCYTAGGEAVGAGGTPTMLHRSELAFWQENKTENDRSSGESVPFVPSTIIIDESTANGRELFYQRFIDAADPGHPFEPLFIAWYVNEDLRVPIDKPLDLDDDELALVRRAHRDGIEIAHEALAWRRMKIAEIGIGDFRQQYPSTPEEAVMGSRGLIITGLRDCLIRPEEFPYDPQALLPTARVGGIDFGYHDPCVIWSGYYVDQVLWAMRCWRKTESLACDQVDGLVKHTTYYCDPANLSDRKHLAQASDLQTMYCKFGPAPRRKHPGEDVATTELKALARMIREGRVRVLYTEASQLILEADTFAWNEKTGKPDDKRTEEAAHYDTIQGLKYMAMGCLAREHPQGKPIERRPTRRESMATW